MAAAPNTPAPLQSFRFRANPAYELIPFERLTEVELQVFQNLRNDRQCYGVLRPRDDPRLTFKSVTGDVAHLFLRLQDAAPLPPDAIAALADRCDSFVLKMVLDEVLQIEVNGEMLSGASAMHVLDAPKAPVEPQGFISALSSRALRSEERRVGKEC